MSKRAGKQTDLGASLNRLVSKLDRSSKGAYLQIVVAQAWEVVAGQAILAHTTGAHMREGGEFVVYVDSPLWATELTSLGEHYRKALNEEIGKGAVKAVRFTVSKKVQDSRHREQLEKQADEFYEKAEVQPVLLTKTERDQVEASVAAIDDEELRKAVLRATIADMQRKKGIAAHEGPQGPREGL